MKIVLYSTEYCPKCKILKQKLENVNIQYEVCEDVDTMINMGIKSVPILEINGKLLDFAEAVQWLKEDN